MSDLMFKVYDFQIKRLSSGDEVVQLKPSRAFDLDFIAEMKSAGVKEWVQRDEQGEDAAE